MPFPRWHDVGSETVAGADAGWQPPARDRLLATLQQRGHVVLHGVPCLPDNAALLSVARSLGRLSRRALPWRSGLVEADAVQRVEALADAPRDQYGKPLLSAHHAAFALHSDESFLAEPCRYVLLHCWRSDPQGGGITRLADRDRVLTTADAALRDALQHYPLPYPFGTTRTLEADRLRYHRGEILGTLQRAGDTPSTTLLAWLERFETLFAEVAISLCLAPGDLLVLDNHRVLHGRRAFAAGSPRLLKRVRVEA